MPNYSLGYLAAALLKNDIETQIIDLRIKSRLTPETFACYVKERGADFVGFFTPSISLGVVKEYFSACRKANPEMILMAGGPHPIFDCEDTLKKIPELDFAVTGEGEETLPELINAVGKGNDGFGNIANLAWRKNGEILVNHTKNVEDLGRFPMPAWELIDLKAYHLIPHGLFSKKSRIAPIITTRGCPYKCTFCGAQKASGRIIRKRKIEDILNEIERLKILYGIEEFHFEDSNFTLDRGFAKDVCREIINSGMKITWACPGGIRIDLIDRELIELMEKSGCYSISVALESGSQRVLDRLIMKKLKLETAAKNLEMIKKYSKMRVTGFFILGNPGYNGDPAETEEEMEETIRYALNSKIDRAGFFIFAPFPGTLKYDQLKKEGKIHDMDFSSIDLHYAFELPGRIDQKKLKVLIRKAYARFYLRPRILLGLLREIRCFYQFRAILKRALNYF